MNFPKENTFIGLKVLLAMLFIISCNESKLVVKTDHLVGDEMMPNISWVRIEAGTFIFGSPEDTPCRAPIAEAEVTVKLTRPFLIADSEITQAQWNALSLPIPVKNANDDLPITFVNFYEALVWSNKLSKLEGFDACYDLSACNNGIGTGCNTGALGDYHSCRDENTNYNCSTNVHKYSDYASCPGYRLPTSAEWEYAAKANIATHTYGGDVNYVALGYCEQDSALDDIAWYCDNSNDELHPVKQKLPNPWGLYDTLGNAYEWTDYFFRGQSLGDGIWDPNELLINPTGPIQGEDNDLRGGSFKEGCLARPSRPFFDSSHSRRYDTGFRPVRTLFE